MLSFLAICARKRLTVDSYEDDAERLSRERRGRQAVDRARDPAARVRFAPGVEVDAASWPKFTIIAHEDCFIANSVKTEVARGSHGPEASC